MIRARFCLLLTGAPALFSGCVADAGSEESDLEGAVPDAATLCKLKPGKTTFDEAKAILGKPAGQSGSMRDSVAVLAYSYSAALTLSFSDGVLSMPTVVGIAYPDCWSSK
jgi:hypothetical protein